MTFSYKKMDFTDFVTCQQAHLLSPCLFELTLPWLQATYEHMLPAQSSLIVHCLFTQTQTTSPDNEQNQLLMALPLVHSHKVMSSLASFYSPITEPLFSQAYSSDATTQSATVMRHLLTLLRFIEQQNRWYKVHISSIETKSLFAQAIEQVFPSEFTQRRTFSISDNYYQSELRSFAGYYQGLPSQLKNTVARREKKLAKHHHYSIDIVDNFADFPRAFSAYQKVYRQSWKSDEYSYAFIEQVCRQALQEKKLRLGLLTLDGEPAAAQIWFIQTNQRQKTASIFKLAYQAKFQTLSVGSILSMALSKYVIEHDQVTAIDFGMGSEPYKHDWLNQKGQRISYQLFNTKTILGGLLAFRKVFLPQLMQTLKNAVKK